MNTNHNRRMNDLENYLSGLLKATVPILLLASVFLTHAEAKTDRSTISSSIQLPPEQALALEQNHGIEIMSIRSSSGGQMIDFRYKVIDADKAQFLMNRDVKPYLLDPVNGAKFFVPSYPKVGSMRAMSSSPKEGRVYFILFSNHGGVIDTGKNVTVVIGDLKIENLVIQ